MWVVQHGCAAIVNLSATPENEALAVEAGAIAAIVRGMEEHRAEATVQEEGCSALSNLCLEEGHKRRAALAGAVEAAVRAMNDHSDNSGVQMQAASMLLNAAGAGVPEVYRRAVAAGALEALEECVAAAAAGVWGEDGDELGRTAQAALAQLLKKA